MRSEERGREIRQAELRDRDGGGGERKDMPEDFRVSITNAPGEDGYPISSFTWLLVPSRYPDRHEEKAITASSMDARHRVRRMRSRSATRRLPKSVVAKEKKQIADNKVTVRPMATSSAVVLPEPRRRSR